MEWLTEKRKAIILNAAVFGLVAGVASLGKSFIEGQPLDLPILQVALGAALTALVLYLQAKKEELETGAAPRKKAVKLGLQ